jgi:hypothetical protein
MGEMINAYKFFIINSEGKKPLGRATRRWNDNIKTNLRKIECGCVDWINLVYDRELWWAFENPIMTFWVP